MCSLELTKLTLLCYHARMTTPDTRQVPSHAWNEHDWRYLCVSTNRYGEPETAPVCVCGADYLTELAKDPFYKGYLPT